LDSASDTTCPGRASRTFGTVGRIVAASARVARWFVQSGRRVGMWSRLCHFQRITCLSAAEPGVVAQHWPANRDRHVGDLRHAHLSHPPQRPTCFPLGADCSIIF
jgi:hypothetical protein